MNDGRTTDSQSGSGTTCTTRAIRHREEHGPAGCRGAPSPWLRVGTSTASSAARWRARRDDPSRPDEQHSTQERWPAAPRRSAPAACVDQRFTLAITRHLGRRRPEPGRKTWPRPEVTSTVAHLHVVVLRHIGSSATVARPVPSAMVRTPERNLHGQRCSGVGDQDDPEVKGRCGTPGPARRRRRPPAAP